MTDDFDNLLDPHARGRESAAAATPRDRGLADRGIPEVTRPKSRLALPAMLLGATLVTGGFVYSVSTAGEAAPQAPAIIEPPAPPPPPVAATEAPVPALAEPAAAAPATRDTGDAVWTDERRRRREALAQRQADEHARAAERRRSPLLVGDSEEPGQSAVADAGPVRLGGDDRAFLNRASADEAPIAQARTLANQGALVAQGTLVPGVLETAIDSDLPGLLRAVVAADVRSFDGAHVLIPRGARLIGQYRSGIAVGQTRAFVVWTRLITPTGVSIALGSPGTDQLGRAGLTGTVDHHFFRRFGAALLLSIVGSAGEAAARSAGDDITINAAGDAARVAEVALRSSVDIPPTIKVRQGTPIRIFVARDLDFSGTAAGGPS